MDPNHAVGQPTAQQVASSFTEIKWANPNDQPSAIIWGLAENSGRGIAAEEMNRRQSLQRRILRQVRF